MTDEKIKLFLTKLSEIPFEEEVEDFVFYESMKHLLAIEIIIWCTSEEFYSNFLGLNAKVDNYLKKLNPFTDDIDNKKHRQRIVHLAEMLYNLKDIKGIETVLNKLDKESLEPLFAELEVGKFLFHCRNLDFEYNVPVGINGQDCDLKIYFKKEMYYAEIKCKVQETNFSASTVSKSIAKAFSQMRKNEQNVIYIKVQEDWINHLNFEILKSQILKQLDFTSRIATIILFWDEFEILENNKYGIFTGIEEFRNNSSKSLNSSRSDLFPIDNNKRFEWITLDYLLQKHWQS